MRFAGALLAIALLAGHGAPAEAMTMAAPRCHALDANIRSLPNPAVVRIVWLGEQRREADAYVTPIRVVVEEVVKGRDIRRDQILAWDDRVPANAIEVLESGPPTYVLGQDHLAAVTADRQVELWANVGFYAYNLRTCYRRSLISPGRP